jgi:predicted dienelactone hydrolase
MRIAAAAAVVTAAALAACSSDHQQVAVPGVSTFEEATERGPFGAGVTTLELIDESRPTDAYRDFPGSPTRKLVTEIWYPAEQPGTGPEQRDAALDKTEAPYPLIVFGHGLPSLSRQSASTLQHLASHGYIVAAPTFPLTNLNAPGGPYFRDVVNQPGDVSIVIDEITALASDETSKFFEVVDLDAVGMAGHSFGGLTALLATSGPTKDERLKVIATVAAPGCFLSGEDGPDLPSLFIAASQDLFVSQPSVRAGYDAAAGPKYYVEIRGADHTRVADVDVEDTVIRPLFGSLTRDEDLSDDAEAAADELGLDLSRCSDQEDEPPPMPVVEAARQRELLRAFLTPFFDAHLKGSDEARDFLRGELPGLAPEARTEFEADSR